MVVITGTLAAQIATNRANHRWCPPQSMQLLAGEQDQGRAIWRADLAEENKEIQLGPTKGFRRVQKDSVDDAAVHGISCGS